MLSDLRLSLRTLTKSPAFALIAISTLALGIGVNTAMFSIVEGIALRGLPFPEQDRLISIYTTTSGNPDDRGGLSWGEFTDLRAQQQSCIDYAVYQDRTTTLSSAGGDPERVEGTAITAAGLATLHAPIELGRWFNAAEDNPGAPATIVLGHALWENRFKADPAILGRQVKLNGESATVIGVAPAAFRFPENADAFHPVRDMFREDQRDNRQLSVFGRLKPGVSVAQAQAEFAAIGQRFAAGHPVETKGVGYHVQTLREVFVDQETRLLLGVMLGAVFFVLLIACANVANLLLARAAAREKELAVRAALGAGRGRVVRLLLTETAVLTGLGALVGLVLAYAGVVLFRNNISDLKPPYWMVFELDGTALLYAAGITTATCLLAGLYPALRASRTDLNSVLKDGGRGSTAGGLGRFTRLLVIGEIAMSCLLLVLSGLMVRTVVKMQSAPLGFDTAGIYHGRVALLDRESKGAAQQRAFFKQLAARLQAAPEIASAGLVDSQPTYGGNEPVVIDGRAPEPAGTRGPVATVKAASPGYLPTLGIPILQGRNLTEADAAEAPAVAVISTNFAEKYWPGRSPLGQRFRRGGGKPGEKPEWITVVGVARQVMQGRFDNEVTPQAYVSYQQTANAELDRMSVFARARRGDAALLAPVLRRTVREVRDDLPVYFAQTMDQMLAEAAASKKIIAWLFGVFGAVAYGLAGIGLYGVMSYAVSQRTQEIGVRVALGATPGDILALVCRQGGWQLGLGLGLGLGAAFFAGQLLATFLYGVSPRDPVTFGTTLLSLGLAGALALLMPALRALRVNPVEALRGE
ncbi:ABC transporter permease [Opitutus sp. GAS368]|jgi:putative ABC transport system permease protein|uniref:ABC transporter permease n=1 Tax=Opitutus sp. GAS368 TaxID=1882749 RepID=UPI00087D767D|nr:ABC transporter permease [Opitutus sp. GAS368]SDR91693.1 duplicated orphan permease [Opitutus sp. GAS368]